MKTAKDMATEYIGLASGLRYRVSGVCDSMDILVEMLTEFESDIRKDQDKITRHMCAEAVADANECCEQPNGNSAIDPDDAHNICMNVKAV